MEIEFLGKTWKVGSGTMVVSIKKDVREALNLKKNEFVSISIRKFEETTNENDRVLLSRR